MTSRERLTARIHYPHDPAPSAEDIFSAALDTLFTDDTQHTHGEPGGTVIYRSPRLGDILLRIPVQPDENDDRLLFAHYLWNAGVIVAEAIETGSSVDDGDRDGNGGALSYRENENGDEDEDELQPVHWDRRFWNVRGLDVLELGAVIAPGTALPSLICALCHARTVVTTDHPSSPAITSRAIEASVRTNITERRSVECNSSSTNIETTTLQPDAREHIVSALALPQLYRPSVTTATRLSVLGYPWGTSDFYDPGSLKTAVDEERRPEPASFDRIIIADCLWMLGQHDNLIRTVDMFLREHQEEGEEDQCRNQETVRRARMPCALVVAGFHTGRCVVRDFIQAATGSVMSDGAPGPGGETDARLRAIEIFEVDVNGYRRAWRPERPGESREQLKRWCVCAVLIRR